MQVRDAVRLQVADAATEMLGVLDEAAAMDNDRIALFASEVGCRAVGLAHCTMPGRQSHCTLARSHHKQVNQAWMLHSPVVTDTEVMTWFVTPVAPCRQLSLLLQARFPGVAAARTELVDAHAALEGLLPEMRRELRQPRLQYTSIINQGDHMIELPVDFRGVPKVRLQLHWRVLQGGLRHRYVR